jgi:hypothetical protein
MSAASTVVVFSEFCRSYGENTVAAIDRVAGNRDLDADGAARRERSAPHERGHRVLDEKLDVSGRAAAVAYALRLGLIH